MAFGNKLGVEVCGKREKEYYFAPAYGEIVAEIAEADLTKLDEKEVAYDRFGKVLEEQAFVCGDEKVSMEEALEAWTGTLEKVFPTRSGVEDKKIETSLYDTKDIYICKHKVARPIPKALYLKI